MTSILVVALAGLVGTSVMIGVMALINRLKLANADMVRAIGSMYTKSYELALLPGLLIHYSAGLVFAFAYAVLVAVAPVHSPGAAIIISSLVGLAHGMIVGLMLEVEVAEHHPVKEFREAGFGVVASHILGHIAYGVSIGLTLAVAWPLIGDHLDDFTQIGSAGDLLGFAVIWVPLFGIPLVFVGYVAYTLFTEQVRSEAHALDDAHHKEAAEKAKAKSNSKIAS